jgi:hypothetical protein
MAADSATTLIYFPEGHLHPPSEGVLPFPDDRFQRLGRVLPPAQWWPIVLSVAGWTEATPSAILTGGTSHRRPPVAAHAELQRMQASLSAPVRPEDRLLLDGHPGPNERWNFSALRKVFTR